MICIPSRFCCFPMEWAGTPMLFSCTNILIISFTPGKRFVVSPHWTDFMPGYLSAVGLKFLLGEQQKRRDSLLQQHTQLLSWGRNILSPQRERQRLLWWVLQRWGMTLLESLSASSSHLCVSIQELLYCMMLEAVGLAEFRQSGCPVLRRKQLQTHSFCLAP